MRPARNHVRWLDRMAIGASTLCLIHCLALPVLFAALPAAAILLPNPEMVHVAAIIFAAPVSLVGLIAGFRRSRWILPLLLGGCGLALLCVALFAGQRVQLETALTVSGSLTIAWAHILN